MEYILSYTFTAMELLSLCLVAEALFQHKIRSWFVRDALIVLVAGCNMALIMFVLRGVSTVIRVVVILAVLNIFLNLAYIGSFREKFLFSVSFFVINTVIDDSIISLSMMTLDYSYDKLIYDKGVYIAGAFTAKILLLTSAALLAKWQRNRRNHTGTLPPFSWLSMLVVPLLNIVIIFLIVRNAMDYNNIGPWVIVITVGLLLCNVVNIFWWNRLEEGQKTMLENELLRHSIKSNMEKMEALEAAYAQQRRQTHDYRSHIRALQGILISGNIEQALDYVNTWADSPACEEMIVHTNNPVVDIILNQAYQAAEKKGILIDYWIEDLAHLPVSNAEFVTVVANLLDNAIEAASQCPGEKAVRVKIHQTEDMLLVSVRNTSLPVRIVNQHIETTKANSHAHGYGLANVKQIIDHYEGKYTLAQSDGWVQFTAIFPKKR